MSAKKTMSEDHGVSLMFFQSADGSKRKCPPQPPFSKLHLALLASFSVCEKNSDFRFHGPLHLLPTLKWGVAGGGLLEFKPMQMSGRSQCWPRTWNSVFFADTGTKCDYRVVFCTLDLLCPEYGCMHVCIYVCVYI